MEKNDHILGRDRWNVVQAYLWIPVHPRCTMASYLGDVYVGALI